MPSYQQPNTVFLGQEQFDHCLDLITTNCGDKAILIAVSRKLKRKVTWNPKYEDQIRKNFHTKSSHRLSEMLMDVRKKGKRPIWIERKVWNSLLEKWHTPDSVSKCIQTLKNRTYKKVGSLHKGSSISTHEHIIRMGEQLGQPIYVDEVFHQGHIKQDISQFVDENPRQTHEHFEIMFSQAKSDVASSVGSTKSTPLDHVEEERIKSPCWSTTDDGKNKGRCINDVGEPAKGYKGGNSNTMQQTQSLSRQFYDLKEITQLREEMHQAREALRQSRKDNELLNRKFQSLLNVVLQFLPPNTREMFQHDVQQREQQLNDLQQQQND